MCNMLYVADVDAEAEEEAMPTAVELCLPWRRNTGREPVSSVETHKVADGSNPVCADAGNWLKGLTHSVSDSSSPSGHDACDPLSVKVDEDNTDQTTPLCSPDKSALNCEENVASDAKHAELKVNVLPPHRKNSRHSETVTQLFAMQSAARFTTRLHPTRCGSFPSSMDAACCAAEQTVKTEAAALLLPWRYTGDQRAIPDQQAPRPPLVTHTKESPEQSILDRISTYPQASGQSFRLSEAESRHSEPVHVQHVITPSGHRVTSIPSDDDDDDEVSEILCNLEQLDSHERICMWLDTLSESNDEVPPELDTANFDKFL